MSKIFFLPVNTGFVDSRKRPTKEMLDFYEERSSENLYCAIVGNVAIPEGFGSNDQTAVISESIRWKALAQRIRQKGTNPGIQLSTTWENYRGYKKFFVKGNGATKDYLSAISKLQSKDIRSAFKNLESGISHSIAHGFGHIQIHAAHGYFFSLLIDPFFCPYYSENIDKIIEIKNKFPATEFSIRLSNITGSQEIDENREEMIEKILTVDMDFFDISQGYYNIDKKLIYPSNPTTLNKRHNDTINLAKKYPHKNFIISGRIKPLKNNFPPNIHIGICRDLIANREFLIDNERGCKNHMKCHYYSLGKNKLSCGLW